MSQKQWDWKWSHQIQSTHMASDLKCGHGEYFGVYVDSLILHDNMVSVCTILNVDIWYLGYGTSCILLSIMCSVYSCL